MNKVILIGNLSSDVELSTTQNGISFAKFSLAVGRNFAGSDGERSTDFFSIVVWRDLADLCGKYLSKGKKAAVVGTLQNRSYETQDGSKRYITEIVANEVEFLTPKSDEAMKEPAKKKMELKEENVDDKLPF